MYNCSVLRQTPDQFDRYLKMSDVKFHLLQFEAENADSSSAV